MRQVQLPLPELIAVAGTRVALGVGLGLLLAGGMSCNQRRALAWTLFSIGALSTFPLLADVLSRTSEASGTSMWNEEPSLATFNRR
jgi:hypothetical protein